MRIINTIKGNARQAIDSLYCKQMPDKRRIGNVDSWWILTGNLQKAVVYSGGVGKDITFEIAVATEYGSQIFLFDPSPTGIKTVESLELPSNIAFSPLGLAGTDGMIAFDSPLKPQEGSFRLGNGDGVAFQCKRISSLLRENNHSSIELLKIDIEGFEYDVIEDIIENNLDIRQIAVEFHDFYPNISREKTRNAITRMKKHGYQLFHKRGHDYSFVKSPR